MKGIGYMSLVLLLAACGNNKNSTDVQNDVAAPDFESFLNEFKTANAGHSLSDTELLKNADTTALRNVAFLAAIPDSVKTKLAGKNAAIKYAPLQKLEAKGGGHYFILKTISGTRKAAVVLVFNADNSYGAAFPFLVPDADPATTQVSTVDKSYSISRSVIRKSKDEVVTEGKDVYAYNADAKAFTLIMTDLLDDSRAEIINPIDTLPKTNAWAGDYGTNKKNIVSIRDGKNVNELNFYIHFEKEEGCIGELTGTALLTSTKTAVYRQGGDACVLEMEFTKTAVTLKEAEGCGLHRGLKCVFDGSYKKMKPAKNLTPKKATTT